MNATRGPVFLERMVMYLLWFVAGSFAGYVWVGKAFGLF